MMLSLCGGLTVQLLSEPVPPPCLQTAHAHTAAVERDDRGLIVAVRRHVFVYDWGSAKGRQLFVDFIAGLLSSGQADGIFSDKWNCALDRALLLPPRVG